MNKSISLQLRFVIYKEGGWWLAHSLEFDIVGEGKSPKEALACVITLCGKQIEYWSEERALESMFRPAPPEFWAMYARSTVFESPAVGEVWPASVTIDRIDARELQLTS